MPEMSITFVHWPLMLVGAYLLGSIPFAQIIAKINGIDLREVGSGNVGAGNVTANLGKGWGALAAFLDLAKGLLPVLLARWAGLGLGAAGMVGLAAVIGHNWSIFMRGRSGRGLATSAGVLVALSPALAIWVAGWAIVGWKIGGGVAGFLGWGLLPIVSVAMGKPPTLSLFLFLLSGVLIGRRMQGNPNDSRDTREALRRAVFDTDPVGDEFPEPVDEPLTP